MSAYLNDFIPQKEIALKYRVSVQLVKDLVSESRNKPEKKRLAKESARLYAQQLDAIKASTI